MTINDLEQFRASRIDCDDIGEALHDSCLERISGIIYFNSLYIEDTRSWPTDSLRAPAAPGIGRWYTIIGRNEYQSDDFLVIEAHLCEFAKSEGYF